MNDYTLTTADIAGRLDLERKAVRRRARALNLGINLEGRAGYRYSEADYARLVESMRPTADVPKRQPKRRRAS